MKLISIHFFYQAMQIHDYLFKVNRRLNDLGLDLLGNTSSESDVLELVPMDVIRADEGFTK